MQIEGCRSLFHRKERIVTLTLRSLLCNIS